MTAFPTWLWAHQADENPAFRICQRAKRFGPETDARQVFDRLAGTWTYWGWKGGYFDTEADARAFYDELRFHARNTDRRAPIPHNGSIRASTGLMGSMARLRDITMSTFKAAT